MGPLFLLVFQEGVDLAGEGGELAARQVHRVGAGRAKEGPVVRDDQTAGPVALEEVLQEDLRAQVEEVRRFVEQQQVRLVQQQRSQFHARLPAAGELVDRPVEVGALEFKLTGHLAALPVGLAAVAHEEIQRGLAGLERVVLPEVAQLQGGMPDHVAAVEFLLAEQDAQQGAFPGAILADEAHLDVVADAGLGLVEKNLLAVTFGGFRDLKQDGHLE